MISKYQPLADYFISQGIVREAQLFADSCRIKGSDPRNTLNSLTTLGLDGKRPGKYLAISAVASRHMTAFTHLDYT
jgi:hypothetical protein